MLPEPAKCLKLLLCACLFAGVAAMGCRAPSTPPAGTDAPTLKPPASATRTPSTTASATPAPTSTPLPEHRIGVRVVDGAAEFYDRQSGVRFVPRGSNYIRLGRQRPPCQDTGGYYHSTFNPGAYDAEQAASALQAMAAQGYNTVRVFLTPGCITDANGKLSRGYLGNVADFLRLAEANGIVVLLATDDVPYAGYRERVPHYGDIDWPNRAFMTKEGVDAETRFWQDLIRGLAGLGAPLGSVLGYSLRNEVFYQDDVPPLSLSSGSVTTGNGRTYDLADPQERQRLMDENLVYWIDRVRAGILEVDPTALVTSGFFQPQGPNPTRIGDPRVIRTYPAIWESSADLIDLHTYPGLDLTLAQYVENYQINGCTQKPIIMGEFGAFRSAYPSASAAAQALQNWQAASCRYGFDGWLSWTWDTEEQPELWHGLSEDGAISRSLAPSTRPDPCRPGAFAGQNVALGKPATASRSLESNPPGMATDGLAGNWWGAGDFAPQWIEIDLQGSYAIARIRLAVSQSPEGETVHRVWGRGPEEEYRLLYEFRGVTRDQQFLEYAPAEPWQGIRFVKVETVAGPSWVSWREIEVIPASGA